MRRFLTVLTAGALVVALVAPATAAASSRPVEYLALGDSLAFGWVPLELGGNPADPDGFVGYADYVAAGLRDHLTNAACPGETSSHLVDLNGADNNCGLYRSMFDLHAAYAGTQLAFMDAFLAAHPKTQLVTIDIGTNDLWVLVGQCGGMANMACIMAGLPGVLAALGNNLDTIYGHLRLVDGYRHKLVALTTYSNDYANPVLTGAVAAMDQVVAAHTLAWGGIVADGFGAFAVASAPYGGNPCAAGLLLVKTTSPLTCDDHASAAGHQLLAQTIIGALRSDD